MTLTGPVFALRDPDEVPNVVDRVLSRMRLDATVGFWDHSWLARPSAPAKVRVGDLDGALELATLVPDAERRAHLLIEIAATMLQDGDWHQAWPLITEAMRLAGGRGWSEVVGKLGRFLPKVVRAVGTKVVDLLQRRQ